MGRIHSFMALTDLRVTSTSPRNVLKPGPPRPSKTNSRCAIRPDGSSLTIADLCSCGRLRTHSQRDSDLSKSLIPSVLTYSHPCVDYLIYGLAKTVASDGLCPDVSELQPRAVGDEIIVPSFQKKSAVFVRRLRHGLKICERRDVDTVTRPR